MEQQSGFSFRNILHVLFKRKWVIVVFFLGTLGAGVLYAVLTDHATYEATAQILLRPGREHVSDVTVSTGGAVRPSFSFQLDEQAARTIALLTGHYLSEQVVRTIGARELCSETLSIHIPLILPSVCDRDLDDQTLIYYVTEQVQSNISATRVGDAALVNLSFRHENADLAAKVINTFTGLYVERHLNVLKNPRADAFLQEQLGVLNKRLSTTTGALDAFKQENGISSSVKDDREVATRQLSQLRAESGEAINREAELTSRIAQLRAQLATMAADPQAVSTTREKLVELESRESELALKLGDRNPALVGLREQIRKTREQLLNSKDSGLYQRLQEELMRSQTELTVARARVAAQKPKLAELRETVEKLDRIEPEFDRLIQGVQLEQQTYGLYMNKSEESRMSDAMDVEKIASVKVIEPARTPLDPLASKLKLKIILAVIFGVAGGLIIAFFLEFMAAPLDTPERVEAALGLPVLTTIPTVNLGSGMAGS